MRVEHGESDCSCVPAACSLGLHYFTDQVKQQVDTFECGRIFAVEVVERLRSDATAQLGIDQPCG